MNLINNLAVTANKESVLKAIDCHSDSEAYEEICIIYDAMEKEIKNLVSPKAVFKFAENRFNYAMEEVRNCSHLVFCAITLGEEISKVIDSYFEEGLYVEGMLLDAMSDDLLDSCTTQLYKEICREAEANCLGLSCKLSPGNEGFPLESQVELLKELNAWEILKVSTTEGFMLRPVKSVSFIFGADSSLDIPALGHECSRCTNSSCKMRKEPLKKRGKASIVNLTVLSDKGDTVIKASTAKSLLSILIDNDIKVPSHCSGNGTCGKCKVKIVKGRVTASGSSLSLSEDLKREGWVLACSTYLKEDCSIILEEKEESYDILADFEDTALEKRPIYRLLEVDFDRKELKGGSLTEIINNKLGRDYEFTLKALKNLSTFINSKGYYETGTQLYGEEGFTLVIHDNTVVDVLKKGESRAYGIAVDIGTTTIALSLVDFAEGKNIKNYSLLNSQKVFGADVISRIKNCNEGKLDLLNSYIRTDLMKGFKELCSESGVNFENIYHICIAGNTTMLYFLLGLPCESLALVPFNTITTSMLEYNFREIFKDTSMDCRVTLLPGASAYVGADIISGMLQCGFNSLEKVSILMDVGTNGEMAIGNKERILCLATAAGPAFEGANISCGTGSIKGAICSVKIKDGQVQYETIGNVKPAGICGSAVIDTASECVRDEIIDETGRFDDEKYEEGYIKLAEGITFNQKDIREVQLAKSAIRSGVEILLQEYGCRYEDVDKVFLAGGFGSHMNIESAAAIGLIPAELKDKVKVVGNSSLGGAVRFLLDGESKKVLDIILKKNKYIDISSNKNFNDLFIENMMF